MRHIGTTKIKAIGIGGAGSNAISRIFNNPIHGIEYITINTDLQDLQNNNAPIRVLIGNSTNEGNGLGGDYDKAKSCFEKDSQIIHENIKDADLVFLVSGMGGGTGTGGTPVTAKIAKSCGAVVISVVTTPLEFEGIKRFQMSKKGISELEKHSDILIDIPNDKLLMNSNKKDTLQANFKKADETIDQSIRSIAELIIVPGEIKLDFADIKTVIQDGGSGRICSGYGYGENKVNDSIKSALYNPLLDGSINGATKIIFNVTGGDDMKIVDVYNISSSLRSLTDNNAEIIFGTKIDPIMENEISITLVATGFPKNQEKYNQKFIYQKNNTSKRKKIFEKLSAIIS